MSSAADLLSTLRMVVRALWRWARPPVRCVSKGVLTFTVALLLLACTRIPFDVHRWLGQAAGGGDAPPEVIVVLGGSGMPSGPELLRLHHAAALAGRYPAATVVVIHPDSGSTMGQMVAELRLRHVEADRIRTLPHGENTREQALLFARAYPGAHTEVVLVTAPENMYRSVSAFRRVGVERARGGPAWEHAMDHHFAYHHERIGGRPWAPDVSERTGLRYTFWNYLKLEITCLREFVAIAYYGLNDWI